MSRLFVEFRRTFPFVVENLTAKFPFNSLFVELTRTFPFVVEAIKQLPMISFVVEFHRIFPLIVEHLTAEFPLNSLFVESTRIFPLIVEHLAAGFPFNPLFVESARTFPMCVEIIRTLRYLQKESHHPHRLYRKRCIPRCICMYLYLRAGSKTHSNNIHHLR